MGERRFDSRVAVISGAGGALGNACARILAASGAKVLVNDLGTTRSGEGADLSEPIPVLTIKTRPYKSKIAEREKG
jgi:NAD(P)-dependent dehydrogenase (short-subunit alcohol dehydrogenase family)